jgi:hypothetical protein
VQLLAAVVGGVAAALERVVLNRDLELAARPTARSRNPPLDGDTTL